MVPNPQQPAPQPDRPYVVSLQLDFNNTGAVDVAKQLREKVGIDGDQPGELNNGKVRLYVIGQGALGAAASEATKHDIAEAEQWNLPIVLIVLLAVFGSLAAAAIPLVLGVCTVVVTMGVVYLLSTFTTMSVFATIDGVDVRHRTGHRLFVVHPDAVPRGTARGPRPGAGHRRRDGHLRSGGRAVRSDGDRLGDRHLPDPHPGADVDGHRRDPGRRRRRADVDHVDSGDPRDVRPLGGQTVALLHWSRRAETTQSRFWTRWVRCGDAPAVGVGAGRHRVPAGPGRAGVLDGAGQQHAAAVPGVARDSRRRRARRPRRWAPARWARSACWSPSPTATPSSPANTAGRRRRRAARWAARSTSSRCHRRVFADDNRSALLSGVLSVDPEDLAARNTVDWLRDQLPKVPGADAATDRRGRADRVDQGLRRPRRRDRTAGVRGFVALIAFVMLLISIRSVFLALKGVLMTVLSVAAAYGSLVMIFQWGWLERARLPADHVDRQHHPAAGAGADVRAVDGLRDLPAHPDPGTVPAVRRHPRRRGLRREHQRAHHHQRGADHDRGVHRVRLRRHATGRRTGRRVRGGDRGRRDRGATGAGARVDGDVRPVELVAAALAGPASCRRSTSRSRCPRSTSATWSSSPTTSPRWWRPDADLRMVVKSAAKLKDLAPDAITVADPLAFSRVRGPRRSGAAG